MHACALCAAAHRRMGVVQARRRELRRVLVHCALEGCCCIRLLRGSVPTGMVGRCCRVGDVSCVCISHTLHSRVSSTCCLDTQTHVFLSIVMLVQCKRTLKHPSSLTRAHVFTLTGPHAHTPTHARVHVRMLSRLNKISSTAYIRSTSWIPAH